MGYDPIWNNFTNSGNINDYLAYKRKKDAKIKKIDKVDSSKTSMK